MAERPRSGVAICRSIVTSRRNQPIVPVVNPNSSPCRTPDVAASTTAASSSGTMTVADASTSATVRNVQHAGAPLEPHPGRRGSPR